MMGTEVYKPHIYLLRNLRDGCVDYRKLSENEPKKKMISLLSTLEEKRLVKKIKDGIYAPVGYGAMDEISDYLQNDFRIKTTASTL